jgi:hypothetical protein
LKVYISLWGSVTMIDSEGWEQFVVSFFSCVGVDKEWLDHITINWNSLKGESACGCVIAHGELEICDGYKQIVEIRSIKARLAEDDDEPLGEQSEIY